MTAAGLGSWLDGVVTKISGESPPLPFDAVATVGGVGFTTIAGLGGCCWIGTVVLAAISFDIDTPFGSSLILQFALRHPEATLRGSTMPRSKSIWARFGQ